MVPLDNARSLLPEPEIEPVMYFRSCLHYSNHLATPFLDVKNMKHTSGHWSVSNHFLYTSVCVLIVPAFPIYLSACLHCSSFAYTCSSVWSIHPLLPFFCVSWPFNHLPDRSIRSNLSVCRDSSSLSHLSVLFVPSSPTCVFSSSSSIYSLLPVIVSWSFHLFLPVIVSWSCHLLLPVIVCWSFNLLLPVIVSWSVNFLFPSIRSFQRPGEVHARIVSQRWGDAFWIPRGPKLDQVCGYLQSRYLWVTWTRNHIHCCRGVSSPLYLIPPPQKKKKKHAKD